jgi:hypothetical protein
MTIRLIYIFFNTFDNIYTFYIFDTFDTFYIFDTFDNIEYF